MNSLKPITKILIIQIPTSMSPLSPFNLLKEHLEIIFHDVVNKANACGAMVASANDSLSNATTWSCNLVHWIDDALTLKSLSCRDLSF